LPPTTVWEFEVDDLIDQLKHMEKPEGLRAVFSTNG